MLISSSLNRGQMTSLRFSLNSKEITQKLVHVPFLFVERIRRGCPSRHLPTYMVEVVNTSYTYIQASMLVFAYLVITHLGKKHTFEIHR